MKKKRNYTLRAMVCLDIVLLLIFIALIGYILSSLRDEPSSEPVAAAEPSAFGIPITPPPSEAPASIGEEAASFAEPEPSPEPSPELPEEYADGQFQFLYFPQWTEVERRSETAVAVTGEEDLPRVDIQRLETRGVGLEEFQLLARSVVEAYFDLIPVVIVEEEFLVTEDGFRASFQVPETAVSPNLSVQVRLVPGTDTAVLAVLLAPEDTPEEELEWFQTVLSSAALA